MAIRDLLGVESPPSDHEPDNMTLGPNLPFGWEGDAWKRKSSDGNNSYWLRAWNKINGLLYVCPSRNIRSCSHVIARRGQPWRYA